MLPEDLAGAGVEVSPLLGWRYLSFITIIIIMEIMIINGSNTDVSNIKQALFK